MTVDEFVQAKVFPQHRGIVKTLRQLMRQHAPEDDRAHHLRHLGLQAASA